MIRVKHLWDLMPYSLVTFVFAPFYLGSWHDGHPMTTVKKKRSTVQRYMKLWKAESSFPLAIYKPHPEKTLSLHMPKGAVKLCKYIAGPGPMFLCYTD